MMVKPIRTLLGFAAAMVAVMPVAAQISDGEIYTVTQSRDVPRVSLGGTVIPYKEVTMSAQIPGRVKYIGGIEGDRFKEGELLVALDDSELLANRNSALAQLGSAEAQLRNAGVQFNRELWSPKSKSAMGGMGMPNLFDQMFSRPMEDFTGTRDRGVERGADIYSSQVQIAQARNAMAQAQAQIQAIDAKLRDAKSVAPFYGVIMKKFVEVGDTMQPGMPLLKFSDIEFLQIAVDVPARLRPGLTEGAYLQAELDVGGQIVPVRVAQIFPMADAQRHTVRVKFDLPQGVSSPGMYAKVLVPDFTASAREHPIIPTSAIRYNGSLPGVYVVDEEGEPELRLIREGERMPNGFTSVLSGLRAGERILENPPRNVASGWSGGARDENSR